MPNIEKLSWAKFKSMVENSCGGPGKEANRTARLLLTRWVEKSEFEKEVKECQAIVKKEIAEGKNDEDEKE